MKILLGMSGGLDSTYAAHKLISEGHTVEGAVLRMHAHTEVDAARDAADALGIKLHVIDCTELFASEVVNYFTEEYLVGHTPNPCVVCNSNVKFRVLADYAKEHGFDKIATGHYASVMKREEYGAERYCISRSRDLRKDQTYMLWRLPQDVLAMLLLPLAEDEKSRVRSTASEIGLTAADREESQEICFVPSGDYAEFIEASRGPSKKGDFVSLDGRVLGEHNGIIRYTVGQRKGLGIAMGERVFVTAIDPQNNTVTLSPSDSYASGFEVCGIVFSGIREPGIGERLTLDVKVRYLAPPISCEIEYLGGGCARVRSTARIRAVAPGQSAVFYDGDLLCMGGFISRTAE